ncbi:hypothetical protein NIES4106_61550 (plasmid) [Fischerella sp. NIES-4106]|nr:hypothetical protein NIES4106_61550 [Fischerella sp. NIES-4106]
MLKALPEIKKRSPGAVTVQAFFTEPERQKFKQYCNERGFDMAHVLRSLALNLMEEK